MGGRTADWPEALAEDSVSSICHFYDHTCRGFGLIQDNHPISKEILVIALGLVVSGHAAHNDYDDSGRIAEAVSEGIEKAATLLAQRTITTSTTTTVPPAPPRCIVHALHDHGDYGCHLIGQAHSTTTDSCDYGRHSHDGLSCHAIASEDRSTVAAPTTTTPTTTTPPDDCGSGWHRHVGYDCHRIRVSHGSSPPPACVHPRHDHGGYGCHYLLLSHRTPPPPTTTVPPRPCPAGEHAHNPLYGSGYHPPGLKNTVTHRNAHGGGAVATGCFGNHPAPPPPPTTTVPPPRCPAGEHAHNPLYGSGYHPPGLKNTVTHRNAHGGGAVATGCFGNHPAPPPPPTTTVPPPRCPAGEHAHNPLYGSGELPPESWRVGLGCVG